MPDDEQQQQQPVVVELNTRDNVVPEEDVQGYIDAAAQDAANSAVNGAAELLGTNAQLVADSTATAMADKVIAHVDAKTEEQHAEDDSASQVTLTEEQWQFVQDEMRIQSACELLTLLMVCACFGAILVRYLVEGWRR